MEVLHMDSTEDIPTSFDPDATPEQRKQQLEAVAQKVVSIIWQVGFDVQYMFQCEVCSQVRAVTVKVIRGDNSFIWASLIICGHPEASVN